jgi:hypothetical protein
MILSQLSKYIAERKRVSLMDMAYHFDADTEALRAMLQVLERKGRLRKLPVGELCSSGGCSKCGLTPPELYESIER